MTKKAWIDPVIHFSAGLGDGGDGTWQAPGSGQSTPDPDAEWTYAEWLEIYSDFPNVLDFDGDGSPGTEADYLLWYQHYFGE